MTPQQFVTQVKSGSPAPVYLFLGPEMYRRRACRKLLIEKFAPEDGATVHDLDETSLRDVLDDASSLSLFASRRVIWGAGAEGALPRVAAQDKDSPDAAAMTAYAAKPCPDVVLV